MNTKKKKILKPKEEIKDGVSITMEPKLVKQPIVSIEKMKEVISKVNQNRKQGSNVTNATKNVGVTISKYYSYQKKLEQLKISARAATKAVKPMTINDSFSPIKALQVIPHKPEKRIEKGHPKQEMLLMVLGSPEGLLDFVKKLQGNQMDSYLKL